MSCRLFVFIVVLLGIASCYSRAQDRSTDPAEDAREKERILIVYLSRTGNTEAVARMIQEEVGGDLVALELEDPYPADYKAMVDQVVRENQAGTLTALKTKVGSIEKYQTIFLGFPTWDMQLPPPMKSFLSQYDLTGKTIVPFNTNAGYGVGSGFQQVRQLCKGCRVLGGSEIRGGIEKDGILFVMEGERAENARLMLKAWLKKIELNKQ